MDFSTRGCKNFLAWLRQKLRDGVQSSSRGKIKNTQVFKTLAAPPLLSHIVSTKKVLYFFVQHLVRPKIFVTFAHDKAYIHTMSFRHTMYSNAIS